MNILNTIAPLLMMMMIWLSPLGWFYFTIKKRTKSSIILGIISMILPATIINQSVSFYDNLNYLTALRVIKGELEKGNSQKVIDVIDSELADNTTDKKLKTYLIIQKLQQKTPLLLLKVATDGI